MQHRRDAHRLADFAQARPHLLQPGFAEQQAHLGAGDGPAARLDDQHILAQKLLRDVGVQVVVLAARVVAADDGRHAANTPGHDGVVERAEGGAVAAAEHVVDVLVREAGNQVFAHVGDVRLAAILVIVNRLAQDLLGDGQRLVLVELDMRRAGDAHLR